MVTISKAPLPPAAAGRTRGPGIGARVRTWFLTGLVVAGPLVLTGYITWWFVDSVDNAVRKVVPVRFWPDNYLPVSLPGFGVAFAFVGLTLLGFVTANLAGRSLIAFGEQLLDRTPVIRSIYRGAKQIFETLFAQNGTSFRRVGLVQFPIAGQWTVVFISAPPSATIDAHLPPAGDGGRVSVFLPCAPNPTTGFYFYLPAKDVIEIDVTPEDAVKLIMSCGLIQPEGQATLAALAEVGRASKIEAASATTFAEPLP